MHLSILVDKEIDEVCVEEVPCTVLNMQFFDRLWKCGVVRESGHIIKCFDEPYGDFVISDKLREVKKGSDVSMIILPLDLSPSLPFTHPPSLSLSLSALYQRSQSSTVCSVKMSEKSLSSSCLDTCN